MTQIRILPDPQAVASVAAQQAVADLLVGITTHGTATWVLAGGTTPLQAYKVLANQYRDALDWSRVVTVMGDERCVPDGHDDSNWTHIEPYLERLGIPAASRLRPNTSLPSERAAKAYDKVLQGISRFDHMWLGVGEDGHTLSLFPGHVITEGRLAVAVHNSPKPPAERISLTTAAVAKARCCLIMATGQTKASVVHRAIDGDLRLPISQAAVAAEARGAQITWLLDEAAHI
jgi:6-phosphogluconolactonase